MYLEMGFCFSALVQRKETKLAGCLLTFPDLSSATPRGRGWWEADGVSSAPWDSESADAGTPGIALVCQNTLMGLWI